MHTPGDYVGVVNGGSYPEVAAQAVRNASQQKLAPVYGYLRAPVEGVSHQRIYLFNTLDEAQGWFMGLAHSPSQLYDYVAVFSAANLSQPVPGLESFGHPLVGGVPQVGNVLPFLLGLPLGGLGGYFYRGWRDQHPGQWIPGLPAGHSVGGPWLDVQDMVGNQPYVGGPWLDVQNMPYVQDMVGNQSYGQEMLGSGPYDGDPWLAVDDMPGNQSYVGGPWLDLAGPQVGGPWLDLMGAEMGVPEQRRAWLQTRGLIESAKRDVIDAQARAPAAAWVWSFDASDMQVVPFSSVTQAQAYMYERLQAPHIALALFDTHATRHWPNPVRWNKSDDPAYAPLIAQRVAEYASTRTAGDFAGRRAISIGSALSDVRNRAQTLASKRAGDVVGVLHATKDQLWHALAFANEDDADDWLETQDPTSFTYAAYFDKNDATWPRAILEKIGGFRPPLKTKAVIGAGRDDTQRQAKTFAYAKALATGTQGNAVGVVHLVDGSWSTFSFPTLDDAIDWLSSLTAHKERYSYAGAFEKGSDGTAYIQQEEFGARLVAGNQRSLAATSGGYTWRAA
jgi:hypothetical protein